MIVKNDEGHVDWPEKQLRQVAQRERRSLY